MRTTSTRFEIKPPPGGVQTARQQTADDYNEGRWEVHRIVRGAERYALAVDGRPTARTLADVNCKPGSYRCRPIGPNGRAIRHIVEELFVDEDPGTAEITEDIMHDRDDDRDDAEMPPPRYDPLAAMAEERQLMRQEQRADDERRRQERRDDDERRRQERLDEAERRRADAVAQRDADHRRLELIMNGLTLIVGSVKEFVATRPPPLPPPPPPALPPVVEQLVAASLQHLAHPPQQVDPFLLMTRLDETVQKRVELVRRVEREEVEDEADREDTAGKRVLASVVDRVADRFLGGQQAALPDASVASAAPDPATLRTVVLQVASDPVQIRGLMQTDPQRYARVFVAAIRGDPALEEAVSNAITATASPAPQSPSNGATAPDPPSVPPPAAVQA